MTATIPNELVEILFVPDDGIAAVAAPTAAELTAGTVFDLVGHDTPGGDLVSIAGLMVTGSTIERPTLGSASVGKVAGVTTFGDVEVTWDYDDEASSNVAAIIAGIARLQRGYIVRGLPVDGVKIDLAAGDVVEVWPVQCSKEPQPDDTVHNEILKASAMFAVLGEPTRDAVIAA